MANLTATQLLRAITKASGTIMSEAEMKSYQHSLVGTLIGNENEVFQNVKSLKKSLEQPTKAILFNRQSIASTTAKTHNHSGAAADSFEVDIAYVQRVQEFQISYKRIANNQFSYQEVLNNKLKQAVMNLYDDISTYAIAWLATNRSQLATDSLILFDEITDYEFDIPFANNTTNFDLVKAAFRTNKFNGAIDLIGDMRWGQDFRFAAAQGGGNSTNLAYTIPNINFVEEPQLAIGANGTSYGWQKGLVGMSSWNEALNRQGFGTPDDNKGLFTTLVDPVFGMMHDVHIKSDIADTSGANGNPQDVVEEYEITSIFTVQGAFESTATQTPIYRFNQLKA